MNITILRYRGADGKEYQIQLRDPAWGFARHHGGSERVLRGKQRVNGRLIRRIFSEDDVLSLDGKPAQGCRVFLMCTNLATTTMKHPILGDVPSVQTLQRQTRKTMNLIHSNRLFSHGIVFTNRDHAIRVRDRLNALGLRTKLVHDYPTLDDHVVLTDGRSELVRELATEPFVTITSSHRQIVITSLTS